MTWKHFNSVIEKIFNQKLFVCSFLHPHNTGVYVCSMFNISSTITIPPMLVGKKSSNEKSFEFIVEFIIFSVYLIFNVDIYLMSTKVIRNNFQYFMVVSFLLEDLKFNVEK